MVIGDAFRGIGPSSPVFKEDKFKELITDTIMDRMMTLKK